MYKNLGDFSVFWNVHYDNSLYAVICEFFVVSKVWLIHVSLPPITYKDIISLSICRVIIFRYVFIVISFI